MARLGARFCRDAESALWGTGGRERPAPGGDLDERRGPESSFCYVGQVVQRVTRVALSLSDGTSTEATLLRGDLPLQLWIAFTDGTAVACAL
jgi:hypothetical protein